MKRRLTELADKYWPLAAMLLALGLIVWGAVANAEEAEPPAEPEPRVMSERCEAWIAWLVDGNRGSMIVRVGRAALEVMAKDCLDRYGNPNTPSPIPALPPKKPRQTAPKPEAGRIDI